jgi:hypothetical protein
MHFESEGDVVPMLCPGCCTIEDTPDWEDWDAGNLQPVAACHRCGFAFPVLPAQFRGLTLHAMHNHRCEGPERGNWEALGKAIMDGITGKGDYPELPPFPPASIRKAGAEEPSDGVTR